MLRLARLAVISLRRLEEERFSGPHPGLLLAGNAVHADLTPEMPLSALLGFLLCGLAQRYGYPSPEGGAGSLTAALVARLRDRGGVVECGRRVERIEVRDDRAVAVVTADGESHPVGRAVLADVSAPALYRDLLPEDALPSSVLRDVGRFHLDNGTVKVDWALDARVPWSVPELGEAGTIHTGDDLDHISASTTAIARGVVPARPTLVIGQMNAVDPSRSPENTATLWAYAHVPQTIRSDEKQQITGAWGDDDTQAYADRIEDEIERHAPGFREAIKARHVMSPRDLEAADRNLVGGAVNGGTSQLHQQVIFRPVPGLARPETPVRGVYLASASAHPGGGVHGACGANAAKAALFHDRRRKKLVGAGIALGGAYASSRALGRRGA
jgi:phytoene dehydrogenase-like protein